MATKQIVSIVGRPNVGKSSLFNRIIGRRIAVVDDFPGVTRDRNYYNASWNDKEFTLVDTGGLIPNLHESLPEAIHDQVDIALKESSVVIFLVEAGTGITDLDLLVAKQLRRTSAEKTILAVNKAESLNITYELDSFRSLGLGTPMAISALHGNGVADMLDKAADMLKVSSEEADDFHDTELKLTIVGRPNAGKSSTVNKLLKENRMIVDSIPGTTRDAVDSQMQYKDKTVVLIDTAGLRKKSHVKKDIEYYSNLRALDSIKRCDICVLIVDVTTGIGVQDMRILRKVQEKRKGLLLVWNKWDVYEKDHKTFDHLAAEVRNQFKELRFVPMISVSALSGKRITQILDRALSVKERMVKKVGKGEFENTVFEWMRAHPHPLDPAKPVRILGAKQVNAPSPVFRFYATNPDHVSPSYERFLIKRIQEKYDFAGCPVALEFRPIRSKQHHEKIEAAKEK
ncbi:ribosome biogenesis GTPase Der [Chitinispirillales bacterium ANBcel5]|uniref:ribosome biogenesis GTPase Der n=1 Tax=Cellulosispirillum alkaliphilum TaxID=3039283 RepID=UPI002A554F68|nr:ribosome biogenesis GTPase Der [Chitinispirillales bacterium ANBcel5]